MDLVAVLMNVCGNRMSMLAHGRAPSAYPISSLHGYTRKYVYCV